MALGKQAKTLNPKQVEIALAYLGGTRYALRNQVMLLLSCKAGLRAKEIASLRWSMVVDAQGQLGHCINLTNDASKGRNGGRSIPINRDLKQHLVQLFDRVSRHAKFDVHTAHVVTTERAGKYLPQSVVNQFAKWYSDLGFVGCSSHSGRRTFITNAARKISTVGGSVRDVQLMAGHSNLNTTQRYIEVDAECQRRVVELV
jgi:integrase/recombinase XerD